MKNLFAFIFSIFTVAAFGQGLPPAITTEPVASQTVCANDYAYISVVATRATTYQWYITSSRAALTDGANYTGSTTADLVVNTAGGFGNGLVFYCIVRNGYGSVTSTNSTLTIMTVPAPTTGGGGSNCGPASFALTATGGNPGSYYWYNAAGTLVSGRANGTYTTPTLTASTTYSVYYISPCTSPTSYITITINAIPAAPTVTNGSACGPSAVVLTASGGSAGQYRWYTAAGVAIAGQTNATYTTPVISATTNYLVSINNGLCEGPTTGVTATINTIPTAPTTTSAANCGPGSVTLAAAGGTAGQYRWYTAAGVAIGGQTNATYTTPALTVTTNYSVSINNGICESTRTPVTATIYTVPTAPGVTPGASCGPGPVTLTASGASAGQYKWYTAAGIVIAGQTNATYTTPSLTVTTNYSVSIYNGTCESLATSVTATIYSIPTAPSATGGSVCGPGTVTLNAAGGTAGQYRWYTAAGVVITGQTNASYVTPTITTTTNYSVSINNGTCESSKTAVTATVNTVPLAPSATGGSSCGPGVVTLTATGGTAGQYRWYTSAGVQIAGQTNATYTTPSLPATTNYSVSINNGTCEGAQTPVTATINTVPAAPGVTPGSNCGPGAIVLTASGASPGQYQWYTAAGVLITGQTNATYTTPTLSATTNYSASIYNGTCESSRTSVTATINSIPTAPSATGSAVCGSGSVTLNATGAAAGQYRWYTAAGVAIAGQTNASYTTPSLTTTTNYSVSINNGTCESSKTTVTAAVNTVPPAPSTTGSSNCGPGAVTLTAAGGTAGQYRWYTSAGVQIAGQTNATYTTPSLPATTNFSVSINNGTCEGTTTPVTATINTVPTAPGVTPGANCGPGPVTLTASGASAGQYKWYNTAGVVIAGQTNATYTTPSLTVTANYSVSIYNGTCESSATSVTATIYSIPTAPSATGSSVCGPGTVTLSAAGGTTGQYRWYTAAGVVIAGQTNASYTTPSLTTTTNYSVSINNGTCESTKTSVSATVNIVPAAPGTAGASSCGPGAITLTASGASAGQYRWYTAAGVAIAGQTNNTYTTPVLTATTNYLVSINNGTCEGATASVTASVGGVPAAPAASGGQNCGPGSITLNASGGSNGQYKWYTAAGVLIAGQTNSSYTTPSLTASANYSVSIDNGCEGPKTSVSAIINTIPAQPTVSPGASCGPASVTLGAAGGTNGQYRWYTSSGTLISGETNSTYATQVLTISTSFYVSINNGSCESSQVSVTATINTVPTTPTATGSYSCGPGSVILTAGGGSNGQYRWYAGGSLISGETSSTYTTPYLNSTTVFTVSLTNGTCESSQASATATINTQPPSPGATGASSCVPASLTLTASGGSDGQYQWYTSNGTQLSGEVNSAYTTPFLNNSTEYYVTLIFGPCESSKTPVVAQINSATSTPGATNGSSCGPGQIVLQATGGNDGQFRWYTDATTGTPIEGATNGAFTTPLITSTTVYYVSINNGFCESGRTAVTAQINTIPGSPATTGASACAGLTVNLTASGASDGQYRWYSVASGGTPIDGAVNGTFTTPVLSATTAYYAAINNGVCESGRTAVTAQINTIPGPPTTTGASGCAGLTVNLMASGASDGQYRWYSVATGGTPIDGAVNGTFTTPVLSATTAFYAAINNGTCESSRTSATATITPCKNEPPVITTVVSQTTPGGEVTIDLHNYISDPDNNLDYSTLQIVVQPLSGAKASIDANGILTLDYSVAKTFAGTDQLTIQICDKDNACTQQVFTIDVEGNVIVYQGISPNNDNVNDIWIIANIEALADTKVNHVSIFDRWGDSIFETDNYDNSVNVFKGQRNNGSDVPTGVYFYKIQYSSGRKTDTGYISVKR